MPITSNFTAGDVLTAASMNLLPRGLLASASATNTQTGITTTADVTNLSVTFTAVTGRSYLLLYLDRIGSSVQGDAADFYITNSSNTVQATGTLICETTTQSIVLAAIVTPSSGSVTYKVRAARAVGTGGIISYGLPKLLLAIDLNS